MFFFWPLRIVIYIYVCVLNSEGEQFIEVGHYIYICPLSGECCGEWSTSNYCLSTDKPRWVLRLSTDQSQESRIQVAESIGLISSKSFNFYYFILFNYTKFILLYDNSYCLTTLLTNPRYLSPLRRECLL